MVEQTTAEIKTHLEELKLQSRHLKAHEVPLSEQEEGRWSRLQVDKTKCEKQIVYLVEVSRQLTDIEMDYVEVVLTEGRGPNALNQPDDRHMTISDLKNFRTKLPHLIEEMDVRHVAIVTQRQDISPNIKTIMELERLEKQKTTAEKCLGVLEEGSRHLEKHSAHIFKNNHGAEGSSQIFAATGDRSLRCVNNRAGKASKQYFGTFSESSIQALCGASTSPTTTATAHLQHGLFVTSYLPWLFIVGCLFANLLLLQLF